MRVELRLGGLIEVGGREIALGQTHALLQAIAEGRSVTAAATRLDLSYRAAWGRLTTIEEALGQPVVVKTKGHGTALTPFGAKVLAVLASTLASFAPLLAERQRTLQEQLTALTARQPRALRLALSHDPLLLGIAADIAGLTATVVGSLDAVSLLQQGRSEIAGFHMGEEDEAARPPFASLFEDTAFTVVPLFRREQGLMIAPGNPLAIGSVADLACKKVRFVNRQRGSGTRDWLDRLLRDSGIRPAEIRGYEVEEFTHQAVAAVVGTGAADAGMGLRSAAERFGLAFVPIGWETFWLAGRAEHRAMIGDIASRAGSAAGANPGYASLPVSKLNTA